MNETVSHMKASSQVIVKKLAKIRKTTQNEHAYSIVSVFGINYFLYRLREKATSSLVLMSLLTRGSQQV
jgi:hypothetical protein